MVQPCIEFLAADLGALDQTVYLRASCGVFLSVAILAVLAPYYEGSDRTFSHIVVDGQKSYFGIAHQFVPVAGQITDCLTHRVLRRDLRLYFSIQACN